MYFVIMESQEINCADVASQFRQQQIVGDLRFTGVPYGSRTRVAAVKGRCPRPLDERDAHGEQLVAYRKLVKLPYRSDAVKRCP